MKHFPPNRSIQNENDNKLPVETITEGILTQTHSSFAPPLL